MNEEDIEILEAIENDLKTIDLYKNTYDIKYAKLLDLYNKQKENNKKLQEGYDKRVGEILKLEQRIEELEEIEEEHRKENGELREYIQNLDKLNERDFYFKHEAIPKSKIKDKIEEISGMLEVGNIEREIYNRGEYAIEVLLELLEE